MVLTRVLQTAAAAHRHFHGNKPESPWEVSVWTAAVKGGGGGVTAVHEAMLLVRLKIYLQWSHSHKSLISVLYLLFCFSKQALRPLTAARVAPLSDRSVFLDRKCCNPHKSEASLALLSGHVSAIQFSPLYNLILRNFWFCPEEPCDRACVARACRCTVDSCSHLSDKGRKYTRGLTKPARTHTWCIAAALHKHTHKHTHAHSQWNWQLPSWPTFYVCRFISDH